MQLTLLFQLIRVRHLVVLNRQHLFRQTHGVIRDSEKFSFDLIGDNNFTNFLYQYYTTHQIPKTIVTSEEINEKESLAKALTDRAGFPVKIILGNKGKRKEMIELILRNKF